MNHDEENISNAPGGAAQPHQSKRTPEPSAQKDPAVPTVNSPWDFSGYPFGEASVSPPTYDQEHFNRIVAESTRAFEKYVAESRQMFERQVQQITAQMSRVNPPPAHQDQGNGSTQAAAPDKPSP